MVKKVLKAVTAACFAGLVFAASTVDAKAALASTNGIIEDAKAQITYYEQMYASAQAEEAKSLAAFNAVKADAAGSQLDYEVAAANYTNSVNMSRYWLTGLVNAKDYLKNSMDHAAYEDRILSNWDALADLTTLQAAKTDADGYADLANGVAAQIADVEKTIAGYQSQLAVSPSLQTQIDELNRCLEALKADYAAKAAVAGEKAALFNNYLNTLNYKAYSLGFEDYQFARDYERDNEDWDPTGYDY